MSALPPKADITREMTDVCFGPQGDIAAQMPRTTAGPRSESIQIPPRLRLSSLHTRC
jgi:hypothetical protein